MYIAELCGNRGVVIVNKHIWSGVIWTNFHVSTASFFLLG